MQVRSEDEVGRRYQDGLITAQAFNAPRDLSRDARQWYESRAAEKVDGGSAESILGFFRSMGAKVIDETVP